MSVICCRAWPSDIKNNIPKSNPTNWLVDRNISYSFGENVDTDWSPSNGSIFILRILDWRFGKWFISFASSDKVSSSPNIKILRISFTYHFWLRFPFDWRNPIGYIVVLIVEWLLMVCIVHCFACAFGLLLGIYQIMMSIGDDIKMRLYNLNEKYQIDGNCTEMEDCLISIVHLHTKAMELSKL